MAKTNLTAINAKTISVNGVPIAGSASPPAGVAVTRFDDLDAASAVALNGSLVAGTLPAGATYSNYDHIDVASLTLSGGSLFAYVPLTNHNRPPNLRTAYNSLASTKKRRAYFPTQKLLIGVPWFWVNTGNIDTLVGNNGKIKVAIEYPAGSGTLYKATKNGAEQMVCPDGQVAWFDPLTVPIVAAADITVRVYAEPESPGGFIPRNVFGFGRSGILDGAAINTATDPTTGAALSPTYFATLQPIIYAVPTSEVVTGLIRFGDSLDEGNQESSDATNGGDTYGHVGWPERLAHLQGLGSVTLSKGGSDPEQWTDANMTMRLPMLAPLKRVNMVTLNEHGTNTYANAGKLANTVTHYGAMNAIALRYSVKVTPTRINCKVTDVTNSAPISLTAWQQFLALVDGGTIPNQTTAPIDISFLSTAGGLFVTTANQSDGTHFTYLGHAEAATTVNGVGTTAARLRP